MAKYLIPEALVNDIQIAIRMGGEGGCVNENMIMRDIRSFKVPEESDKKGNDPKYVIKGSQLSELCPYHVNDPEIMQIKRDVLAHPIINGKVPIRIAVDKDHP
jgi:hypothetical protein